MQPAVVLQTWTSSSRTASRSYVLPDGCRDLILNVTQGAPEQWFVSSLMDTPQIVETEPGETFQGHRFYPGALIDEAGLLTALDDCKLTGSGDVFSLIEEFVYLDKRVGEALAILAESPSVANAAQILGVSERTLERLVTDQTQRSPSYWRSLARIRRTAASLHEGTLADIAAHYGYSDQAHMSREFKRWFGLSPTQFKVSPTLRSIASQSGYG